MRSTTNPKIKSASPNYNMGLIALGAVVGGVVLHTLLLDKPSPTEHK
jgi:hypothetical protein